MKFCVSEKMSEVSGQ